MTDKSVDDVIKALVMAHHDDEVKSIGVVFINAEGEPELEIGINHQNMYKIIAGLEILKLRIIELLIANAAKPPKDRL